MKFDPCTNALSMEKLPLLVHGKAITDQEGQDNVGREHRLPLFSAVTTFHCRFMRGHCQNTPIQTWHLRRVEGAVLLMARRMARRRIETGGGKIRPPARATQALGVWCSCKYQVLRKDVDLLQHPVEQV